jgi:hypothetical protein
MEVNPRSIAGICFIFYFLLFPNSSCPQDRDPTSFLFDEQQYPLYPETIDTCPDLPSPLVTETGMEIVLVSLKNQQFAFIPVTVENGSPLVYSYRIKDLFGKDRQLQIDSGDFPSLANTGLHAASELQNKEMITGFPVSLITYIGRPGRFSSSGFLAEDEDIISVLQQDNKIVKKLGLTHPRMAEPLFHIWNIILKEIELGNLTRDWDRFNYILYNGRKVVIEVEGGKGWQLSIFQDEIKGRFSINICISMTESEIDFLTEKYSFLNPDEFNELKYKLTCLHFSEMAPYYIKRYGFYEGHTDWRSDPIVVAYLFGLRSLEEIENIFDGNLYTIITRHFVKMN